MKLDFEMGGTFCRRRKPKPQTKKPITTKVTIRGFAKTGVAVAMQLVNLAFEQGNELQDLVCTTTDVG